MVTSEWPSFSEMPLQPRQSSVHCLYLSVTQDDIPLAVATCIHTFIIGIQEHKVIQYLNRLAHSQAAKQNMRNTCIYEVCILSDEHPLFPAM